MSADGGESFEFGGELDFWATPRWAVDALFSVAPVDRRWLIEPAAGTGELVAAALEAFPKRIEAVDCWEFDPGRAQSLRNRFEFDRRVMIRCGNFLAANPTHIVWEGSPFILMNPPYSKPRKTIGLEFVQKALEVAAPSGKVAALLPLDFATGTARCAAIHDRYRCSVYPLRRRPHFGGPRGSGMRPFAWFVWDLLEPKSEWRVVG